MLSSKGSLAKSRSPSNYIYFSTVWFRPIGGWSLIWYFWGTFAFPYALLWHLSIQCRTMDNRPQLCSLSPPYLMNCSMHGTLQLLPCHCGSRTSETSICNVTLHSKNPTRIPFLNRSRNGWSRIHPDQDSPFDKNPRIHLFSTCNVTRTGGSPFLSASPPTIDIFAIAVLIRGLSLFIDKSFRQISAASCNSIVYRQSDAADYRMIAGHRSAHCRDAQIIVSGTQYQFQSHLIS